MRARAASARPAWLSPVTIPRTKKAHSTRPSAFVDQPQEFLTAAALLPRFATARFATAATRPRNPLLLVDHRFALTDSSVTTRLSCGLPLPEPLRFLPEPGCARDRSTPARLRRARRPG